MLAGEIPRRYLSGVNESFPETKLRSLGFLANFYFLFTYTPYVAYIRCASASSEKSKGSSNTLGYLGSYAVTPLDM
jgi:hypothetical protein